MTKRLLCLLIAAALAGCLAGSTGEAALLRAGGSQTPPARSVVVILNPTKRVHDLVFTHAKQIVRTVNRSNLLFVALYEQRGSDDGPPFDRPIVETKSPVARFTECSGSGAYDKGLCREQNQGQAKRFADQLATWKRSTVSALSRAAAANATEESPTGIWNLSNAFLRAGRIFSHLPQGKARCMVLLGGLVSSPPPAQLQPSGLDGVTVIVSGWVGTPAVETAWRQRLSQVGAKLILVPAETTTVELIPAVGGCANG